MTFEIIFTSLDEIRENVYEFRLSQERKEYLSELKKGITEFIDELEIRKAKLEEECGALEKAAQAGEPVPSLTYVYGQLFDLESTLGIFNNKLKWIGIWEKVEFPTSGRDQSQPAGDERETREPDKIRWMSTEAKIIILFKLLHDIGLIHQNSYSKRYNLIEHHFVNKQNQPFKAKQLSNAYQQIPSIDTAIAELKKDLCSS